MSTMSLFSRVLIFSAVIFTVLNLKFLFDRRGGWILEGAYLLLIAISTPASCEAQCSILLGTLFPACNLHLPFVGKVGLQPFGPLLLLLVRMEGLEPTRLAAPDPKSGTSTNFATSAVPDEHDFC